MMKTQTVQTVVMMVVSSYTRRACGGRGRQKMGVFSQIRHFVLLLELESHPASAIKLPPGQAVCSCAQAPQGIAGLKQKQGLQAERVSHMLCGHRGLYSYSLVYCAVKARVTFLLHSIPSLVLYV